MSKYLGVGDIWKATFARKSRLKKPAESGANIGSPSIEASEAYTYSKLDPSRRQIQLLTVNPESESNPQQLTCTLSMAFLDQNPKYEAISYAWGDTDPSHYIDIDGRRLAIPANTWGAIRRMRLRRNPRTLWIDAVCINQQDREERSRQVAFMGDIFAQCTRGLIYLGEGVSLDARMGAICITNLTKQYRRLRLWSQGNMFNGLPRGHVDEEVLLAFFRLAWFRRAWVTQEAVLAPECMCSVDEMQIKLANIIDIASRLFHRNISCTNVELLDDRGLWAANDLRRYTDHLQGTQATDFHVALQNRRGLQTSDDRDRVFALLGIYFQGTEIPDLLIPDYSKPYSAVARDAARWCIEHYASLCVLRYVAHEDDEDVTADGFSSWTPHFKRDDHHIPPHNLPMLRRHDSESNAAIPFSTKCLILREDLIDPNLLHLQGSLIDAVAGTTTLSRTREFSPEVLEDIASALLSFDTDSSFPRRQQLARLGTASVCWDRSSFDAKERDFLTDLVSHLQKGSDVPPIQNIAPGTSRDQRDLFHYAYSIFERSAFRKILSSAAGYLGLGPKVTQAGDIIMAATIPEYTLFVLRPLRDGTHHLIGNCYVDEFRTVELLEQFLEDKEERIFSIR